MATAQVYKRSTRGTNLFGLVQPEIHTRLTGLYEGILNLKHLGYPIDIIIHKLLFI
ncbi:MAG: hypothetical protein IPL31_04465 [Saprospiraceae bacterium]|nr:hypothetical protein [Saprospiraceae bacterium]